MNHSDIRARMADYLEGDLRLEDRALFDAHLDACEQCAQELEELQAAIALLRSLPDPEPPPNFVDAVMRRVRAGEGRPSVVDRVREWISSLATPGFAIPATAVAAALGIALLTGQLNLAQLGLGFPWRPEVAATQAARVQGRALRPGSSSSAPATEMRVASKMPAAVPLAPAGEDPMAGQRSLVSASRSSSPAGSTRTRTRVRIRISQNHPAGGSTSVGNPLRASGALPSGRLVGASSALEAASAEGSAAPGLAAGEIPGVRSLGYVTSPPDPSRVSSDRQSEEQARTDFRRRELDLRLNFLLRSPVAFAAEFADLSGGERDLWLRAIAEHAVESQLADRVLETLQATGDPRAVALAEAFAADLRELRRAEPDS